MGRPDFYNNIMIWASLGFLVVSQGLLMDKLNVPTNHRTKIVNLCLKVKLFFLNTSKVSVLKCKNRTYRPCLVGKITINIYTVITGT